jgi:hypothetical protein
MKQMDLRLGQRWSEFQPSKGSIFWAFVIGIIVTIVVGFYWGGWVTGGTAERMSSTAAQNAVTQRMASICVAQFEQEAERDANLAEFQSLTTTTQRTNFVRNNGWATMPDATQPDRRAAEECARQLMLLK